MRKDQSLGCTAIDSLIRKEASNGAGSLIANPELSAGRKVAVCIGDSITRGQVSCNYVEMLQAELGRDYFFVNAGINGELSFNVLRRLDEVVRCSPDYITLLIGTNDAHAMIDRRSLRRARRYLMAPETPSVDNFEGNLRKIVSHLQDRTGAKIALLSIPPIGENLGDHAMGVTSLFCRAAEKTAGACGVVYLPLFEEMMAVLEGSRLHPKRREGYSDLLLLGNIIHARLLRRSYDAIAARRRFLLHTDLLHLSCAGAEIVARLIRSFLDGSASRR